MLFREANEAADFALKLPLVGKLNAPAKKLGGDGTATLKDGVLNVQIPAKLRFIWIKF